MSVYQGVENLILKPLSRTRRLDAAEDAAEDFLVHRDISHSFINSIEAMFNPRFLIVSLGNPLPKYASLHSAGHFTLNGLASFLQYPAFREVKIGKHQALVSQGPKYTLIQSPTLMNVSGSFVARAWQEMLKEHDAASSSLVLLHDELERDFGVVRLTAWDRSHKGHNGVRSVKTHLNQDKYPESPFVRIALGIGRPEERDAATVSNYVLGQISAEKRRVLEEDVPSMVSKCLRQLEEEWRSEIQ
jgi:PTH1 family peptidyl-tRNA hydrolase